MSVITIVLFILFSIAAILVADNLKERNDLKIAKENVYSYLEKKYTFDENFKIVSTLSYGKGMCLPECGIPHFEFTLTSNEVNSFIISIAKNSNKLNENDIYDDTYLKSFINEKYKSLNTYLNELNIEMPESLIKYNFELDYLVINEQEIYGAIPSINIATINRIKLMENNFQSFDEVGNFIKNMYSFLIKNKNLIKFDNDDYMNFYLDCGNIAEYKDNNKLCEITSLPLHVYSNNNYKIHVHVQDKNFQNDGIKHNYDFDIDLGLNPNNNY
jgi:hypothetical protein